MNKLIYLFGILFISFIFKSCSNAKQTDHNSSPNVILIMTDDQGFGDIGYYGNHHIKTPVLDKLASESVRFTDFLVSPVCAPTRSSLMTGRYPLRTGVRDTYQGGAIMASSEITIAEVLQDIGYTTGMIGKWHLGDNYPCRPEDQGFDYTLRHLAGGIGQWGDWPNHLKFNTSYFNPTLWQNGKMVESTGYCSDVFTNAAIQFIENNKEHPFFLYLAFNAPHDPLQVPDEYYNRYKDIDPSAGFEHDNRPFPEMNDTMKEKARKVYAMVNNIDDNLARLLNKVDQLNLRDNTLVIFMSDNGPIPFRYIAGLRGRKSSVYEGGIQVPCFWRYPKVFKGNRDITTTASHFDIFPTIAELCGAKIPTDRQIDGVSLLPQLKGDIAKLPERYIARYWKRRGPEKYKNMMIRNKEYKLIGNCDSTAKIEQFELYNLAQDPYEQTNIVDSNKETANVLKGKMDSWINELMKSPNAINSPRIVIGTTFENPSMLNLNDVHFTKHEKVKKGVVYWKTDIAQPGSYKVNLYLKKEINEDCEVQLQIGEKQYFFSYKKPMSKQLSLRTINLTAGKADIVPIVFIRNNNKTVYQMPFYVEIERIDI
ncbi:arylsulfatase [Puteibacter caeruleilacunae]|nr:arylsulfatase [Puteibacter caeruleilacunae]